MQSVVAQTNHQKTKIAVENKWHGDLFTNGENLTAKTPSGDFQVTTPETPLLSQQAVTSKESQVPYQPTVEPLPQYPIRLVVVTVPLSDARLPSTWLTNCTDPSTWLQSPIWKDCWLHISSIHPHDEDQEDAWSQNPKVQIHSNFSKKEMN